MDDMDLLVSKYIRMIQTLNADMLQISQWIVDLLNTESAKAFDPTVYQTIEQLVDAHESVHCAREALETAQHRIVNR